MIERFDAQPVTWEISMGAIPTRREKKGAAWIRIKRVPLDLPSGRLVIDSDGPSPPQTVVLPKGKYELVLHMVDQRIKGAAEVTAYRGPEAILTLEPWPEDKAYNPELGH